MAKILLISTIYPRPVGNIGTHVCHFFTKEWVKMGHDVKVVHIQAVYPRIFYALAKLARKKIVAKTAAVVYTHREEKVTYYEMDNVPICRIPVYKPMPHRAFTNKSLNEAEKVIISYNEKAGFVPDYIIGHFPNPQLRLLFDLKQHYKTSKTCEVLHLAEEINQLEGVYGKNLNKYLQNVDVWGFRFKYLQQLFSDKYGTPQKSFICYSGIPEHFITQKNSHSFERPLSRFVYVGSMIERKYPSLLIDSLIDVYPNKDFSLTYVGSGQQLEVIERKKKKYGLEDTVSILGRIPREQIVNQFDNADCMIMISKGEAFGLVYLEAMARGCITVASRNEGFDGVIEDGVNGFLCDAGNSSELSSVIKYINSLTPEQRQTISDNAIETAKRLTDYKAAQLYLSKIEK